MKNILRLCSNLLAVITLAMGCVCIYTASNVKIVPTKYVVIGAVIYLLLTVVILLLLKKSKKTLWRIVAVLIFAVVLILTLALFYNLSLTKASLQKNMSVNLETTQVSVYVDKSDSAKTIDDAKEYTFGILRRLDRENTDGAISQIVESVNNEISVVEYDELTDLADGMLAGEVQAIILNEGYVSLLKDWNSLIEDNISGLINGNDYDTFGMRLRKLAMYEMKQTVNDNKEKPYNYVDAGSFIMYISGQDEWGSVSARSRSDVNILAVVNTHTRQLTLISTPRDYYLPLSVSNGEKDKLTHAGIYGVSCSRDTLEMLYGCDIEYYIKVNFSGFEAIIDALGGVNVWSDYDFTVEPIKHYVKGNNYLSGVEALAFARERYKLPGGDNARGKNQMNVIISVVDKLCSSAILNNYTKVLNSLEGAYITDMPYDVIASLIRDQIAAGEKWTIRAYAVSGTDGSDYAYSIGSQRCYVMYPNDDTVNEAKNLIKTTLDGTIK